MRDSRFFSLRSERRLCLVAGSVAALCWTSALTAPDAFTIQRGIKYGPRDLQRGDLLMPEGNCHGLVMLVHGGFWQGTYDATLMVPLASDLVGRSFAVWNIDYRSLGTSGGYPETFDDVSMALDWLATDAAKSLGVRCGEASDGEKMPVAVVGHSAGGHLALWLGLRPMVPASVVAGPVGPQAGVKPKLLLAQAGVCDLEKAYSEQVGGNIVKQLLGTPSVDEEVRWRAFKAGPTGFQEPFRTPVQDAATRWVSTDPAALARRLSADSYRGNGSPVFVLVHGVLDDIVPLDQSTSFSAAVEQAGLAESVVLDAVQGERHFEHLEPRSRCWGATLQALYRAVGVEPPRPS